MFFTNFDHIYPPTIHIVGKPRISASIWHQAIKIWCILQAVRISVTDLDRLLNSSWHCVITLWVDITCPFALLFISLNQIAVQRTSIQQTNFMTFWLDKYIHPNDINHTQRAFWFLSNRGTLHLGWGWVKKQKRKCLQGWGMVTLASSQAPSHARRLQSETTT